MPGVKSIGPDSNAREQPIGFVLGRVLRLAPGVISMPRCPSRLIQLGRCAAAGVLTGLVRVDGDPSLGASVTTLR